MLLIPSSRHVECFKFNFYTMKNYRFTNRVKYDKIKYLHIKIVVNLLGSRIATQNIKSSFFLKKTAKILVFTIPTSYDVLSMASLCSSIDTTYRNIVIFTVPNTTQIRYVHVTSTDLRPSFAHLHRRKYEFHSAS